MVTDENLDVALVRAQDALTHIADNYPMAYYRFTKGGAKSIIPIVVDAVFRVFRDAEADGITTEHDGVYSYTTSYGSQSSDIYFPSQAKATLDKLNGGGYAIGSIRRGGI